MWFRLQFDRQNRVLCRLHPRRRSCQNPGIHNSVSRDDPGGPQGMLRVLRVRAGLTQEQLAELSGLSVRAISDIERGTTIRPRRSSIALLEAALEQFSGNGAVPSDDALAADGRAPVLQQLPPAVPGFTGRARELDALTHLLDPAGAASGTVVISAIAGAAGVGKTALALHWAHQAAEYYPEGQLYVNLRGYDPDRPVPAASALARLLRALGVPGPDIPPEEDERAALYRSLLAGRRMLVVLDNAGLPEQVRPLLPGTVTCGVLVTSRDSLAGLVARDGAARLDLDLLPVADAVALLRDADRRPGGRRPGRRRETGRAVLAAAAGAARGRRIRHRAA